AGRQAALMQPVAEYLGALQSERGASRNTLAAYRRDLEDFHRFLRTRRLTPPHVTAEHVVPWLEGLRARGLAPASVARRLSALRGFYRHLVREGELHRDPTEHLDTPRAARPLPRALSIDSARVLVEAPDVRRPAGVRDRAVLELLYASRMRASQVPWLGVVRARARRCRAGRRTRPRRARAPLCQRHARLRVSGAGSRGSEPRGRLR